MTLPTDSSSSDNGIQDITSIMVPQLTDMMVPELLQEFQDTFANALGVCVAIRDVNGERITQPSPPHGLGARIMKMLGDTEGYEKGSSALALKAMDSGRMERSRNRAGFLQFAVPVTIQGRSAGALVVGGVLDEKIDRKKLEAIAHEMNVTPEELQKRSTEELSLAISLLQFAADALANLCHEGWVVRRHVEELRTLHQVSELLNSTRQVDDVLRLVVGTVCETLEVKACGLRLLAPDTGELVLKAVDGLSEQYLSKGPVSLKRSEIDRTAMEGPPVYVRDISTDPRILYPSEMTREGIRSILIVGLKVRGKAIGALRIYTGEKRLFHQSEIALAEAIANLAAIAITNAELYEEALEKDRLERELTLAAQIQSHLLPAESPQPEGFDICAINQPCRQVGGDFYDYLPDPYTRRLGIVIADVCGKSMAGALLMATARSAIRVQAEHCTTAAEIVTRANMSLCRDTRPEEFVTLFFGKLDTETRVLHYANAGHSLPQLYRGDEVIPLEGSGMVCGVLPENTYHERDLQFEPGDILLLYTDGLDEARNPENQLFGLERTEQVIRENRDRPASEIVRMLRDEVRRFTAGREPSDDLTLLLIKVE